MIRWEKLFTALVGSFVVGSAVQAAMVPVSDAYIEGRQSARACSEAEAQPTDSASLLDHPSVTDLMLQSIRRSPGAGIDLGRASQTRPPQILMEGESNLNLCLSALICLGLCSSSHYVKKLSFGFIPEWYHDGGPFQIGHSIAVSPDSVCSAPLCCFVQPVWTPEDRALQYRLGTIVSLWRESQFTSDVLAARGPPMD